MPGIVGIVSRRPAEFCQPLVEAMVGSMLHEPFYTSGTQAFPDLGIYAGWVAHEGSLAADQVFWNERHDVALLFSGECFPDPDTLLDLAGKGHALDPTPGGWLVHLYEELGDAFFASLNGLFSGLLVDLRNQTAFLFNDRYGLERLYWHEAGDATYFASEARALLRVLPELRAFDLEGVGHYLAFGCTLDWKTLFRGVHLAPGAALWKITGSAIRRDRYFNPDQWEQQEPLSEPEFDERFRALFPRILPRYLESSRPAALSLTGGLDTRMIVAALPAGFPPPSSYTFSAANGETLDDRIARRVAVAGGLSHELLRIGPDFFTGYAELAERTVSITDGCFGALGTHEIYLNRLARRRSPVRLTGNFGSEVLRGMSTFKPQDLAPGLLNPEFAAVANEASHRVRDGGHPVTFAAFEEIPWNLFGSLQAGRSQLTFRTPYLDNELVALAYRTPQKSRTSPQGALRFVAQASSALAAIPTDRGLGGNGSALTRSLRGVFAAVSFKLDYHCSEGLPGGLSALDPAYRWCNRQMGIMGLHKYLSYARWTRGELAGFVAGQLQQVARMNQPFWNPAFLSAMVTEHAAGRRNYTRELNAVITLGTVERLMFSAPAA